MLKKVKLLFIFNSLLFFHGQQIAIDIQIVTSF